MAVRDDPAFAGSYTGDGANLRDITGLGFEPVAVLVLPRESEAAHLLTAAMPAGESLPLDDRGPADDAIVQLLPDGFRVGGNKAVNRDGKQFHYVAWRGATTVVTGSFAGDGTDDRMVGGLGLRPDYLLLKSNSARPGAHRTASLGSGDVSLRLESLPNVSNFIQGLADDGFQVGSDPRVNPPGSSTYYLALAATTPPADLSLRVVAADPAPDVGDTVRVTVTLENLGPAGTTGVQVDCPLPAGLAFAGAVAATGAYDESGGTWNVGAIAPATSTTLHLDAVPAGRHGRTAARGGGRGGGDRRPRSRRGQRHRLGYRDGATACRRAARRQRDARSGGRGGPGHLRGGCLLRRSG